MADVRLKLHSEGNSDFFSLRFHSKFNDFLKFFQRLTFPTSTCKRRI